MTPHFVFSDGKFEFSSQTSLFLLFSLKEDINFQQQMFRKGHYIYKYEQNPPVKDEI